MIPKWILVESSQKEAKCPKFLQNKLLYFAQVTLNFQMPFIFYAEQCVASILCLVLPEHAF